MPRFRLSMRALACRLEAVLNILCFSRNEGFPSFVCVPLFCGYSFRRSKGRRAPPFDEFLRLTSFNVLDFFLACELRGDVELFWHPPLS